MSIYEDWRAYAEKHSSAPDAQKFWTAYLEREKHFYEKLLRGEIEAKTPGALAQALGVPQEEAVGFLDGINESLKAANELEALTPETEISLDYDPEKLYYNMVAAKAEWLYTLPEWEDHLTKERRAALYKEQKRSTTVVKGPKIGRNDPCPCGSGKKYKKCCGRDVA